MCLTRFGSGEAGREGGERSIAGVCISEDIFGDVSVLMIDARRTRSGRVKWGT